MKAESKESNKLVRDFREILIWPLQLRPPTIKQGWFSKLIRQLVKSGNWTAREDLYDRNTTHQESTRYAELVYFHPFVQRFIYKKNTPVRLFVRDDINKVRAHVRYNDKKEDINIDKHLELIVDRVHLYLFKDMEIAILTLEVSGTDIELIEAQIFLDQFRRAYPPYWDNNRGGHCPVKVEWEDKSGHSLAVSDYNEKDKYLNFVNKHKQPLTARHWLYLLAPLKPYYGEGTDNNESFYFKHIVDDRIPHMCYLAFDNPIELTCGDFMRIGFADEPGNSYTLPYAEGFMKDFKKNYCYDRFWGYDMNCPATDWLRMRYILTGYGFTMIGPTNKQGGRNFYCDAEGGALAHFRHHYFQMGLVAHFHKAALLVFLDRLSKDIEKYNESKPDQFREFYKKTRNTLGNLLLFTSRYWFPDLSNQVQGQELFHLWSKHLGTQALFNQVSKEARDVYDFLEMREQRKQTDTSVRLTVVATVGLILALLIGFFSMEIIVAPLKSGDLSQLPFHLFLLAVFFVIFVLIMGAIVRFSKPLSNLLQLISSGWRRR